MASYKCLHMLLVASTQRAIVPVAPGARLPFEPPAELGSIVCDFAGTLDARVRGVWEVLARKFQKALEGRLQQG